MTLKTRFPDFPSEDSNLETRDLLLFVRRLLNGMNTMRIGSPVWTILELLRHKLRLLEGA